MNDNKSTNIGSEIESVPNNYISDSTKWMLVDNYHCIQFPSHTNIHPSMIINAQLCV